MAFPTPSVTKGTCTGAAALMTSLQSHWGGTSTKFELSTGVAYDAGDTLCIEPISDAIGGGWQINIRRTSTTAFKVQLDPSGSITDAGSTVAGPTGASTYASFEDTWSLQSAAVSLSWLLCEWDDAVMLLVRDTTDTYHYNGFHSGRTFTPLVLGAAGIAGGFGNHCGNPHVYTSYGGFWFGGGLTTSSAKVGNTGTQATDWTRYPYPYPSTGDLPAVSIGGAYYPSPVVLSGSSSLRHMFGVLKYIYMQNPPDTPDTRLEDPSSGTDRWMHIGYSGSTYYPVIPWPDATDPKP